MFFTNKSGDHNIQIRARDTILDLKTECKFLGVLIDNKLDWKAHINHIANKISKNVALLKFFKFAFPKDILRTLYSSLILPYLNYCNIVWGAADKTLLEPLVILQKKAIRAISKVYYLEHTDPLFKSMKLTKLEHIYKLNCLLFIYKCINLNQYTNFKNRLVKKSDLHNYDVRNKNLYRLPVSRLKKVRQSFLYTGIIEWNGLSLDIIESKTIYSFKIMHSGHGVL